MEVDNYIGEIDDYTFVTQHEQMRRMSVNNVLRYEGKHEAW